MDVNLFNEFCENEINNWTNDIIFLKKQYIKNKDDSYLKRIKNAKRRLNRWTNIKYKCNKILYYKKMEEQK